MTTTTKKRKTTKTPRATAGKSEMPFEGEQRDHPKHGPQIFNGRRWRKLNIYA